MTEREQAAFKFGVIVGAEAAITNKQNPETIKEDMDIAFNVSEKVYNEVSIELSKHLMQNVMKTLEGFVDADSKV